MGRALGCAGTTQERVSAIRLRSLTRRMAAIARSPATQVGAWTCPASIGVAAKSGCVGFPIVGLDRASRSGRGNHPALCRPIRGRTGMVLPSRAVRRHGRSKSRDRSLVRHGQDRPPVLQASEQTDAGDATIRLYLAAANGSHRHISAVLHRPRQRRPRLAWGLTENRLRLDHCPATSVASFFPPRASALCTAKQKSRRQPPSTSFQPFRCGLIVSGRTTRIEVATGAARRTET